MCLYHLCQTAGMVSVHVCHICQIFLPVCAIPQLKGHSNVVEMRCSSIADPSGNEVMLEVFQFPRDTWVKEIEDIKPKLMQTEEPKLLDTSLTQQLPITDEVQEVRFKLNNVV